MALLDVKEHTLLEGVSATGAGTKLKANRQKGWNFIFLGLGVTSGATINIEIEYIPNNWVTIHTETITANGTTIVQSEHGHFPAIRANVTALTDGIYWVFAQGSTTGY
jgi:ribosomal protein S8E